MAKSPDARMSVTNIGPNDRIAAIDSAALQPVEYEWGSIKWICDVEVTPQSLQSLGYAYVLPGKTNPQHSPRVLRGDRLHARGSARLLRQRRVHDGATRPDRAHPRGLHHSVANNGWEPVVYIASFSAAFRDTVFDGATGQLHDIHDLR